MIHLLNYAALFHQISPRNKLHLVSAIGSPNHLDSKSRIVSEYKGGIELETADLWHLCIFQVLRPLDHHWFRPPLFQTLKAVDNINSTKKTPREIAIQWCSEYPHPCGWQPGKFPAEPEQ